MSARLLALLWAITPILPCQDTNTLVQESARLRALPLADLDKARWAPFQNLLRDWIESRLPPNLAALDPASTTLENQLTAELWRTGILEPERYSGRPGYVGPVKLIRPAEFPDTLVLQAGITVPCGSDESVYVYRFDGSSRVRVLEAAGVHKWGSHVMETRFSEPDAAGNRIFYVSWFGVQCASVWNELDYRLYRVGPGGEHAERIFSTEHEFTIDDDPRVKLTPGELLVELTSHGMAPASRQTYVLRYSVGESVQRIDPVALQPQDFVHEWLIEPWEEMESRSSDAELAKWHDFLKAASGDYEFAQLCQERPGFTQVGVDVSYMGDREVPEPLPVYFLVEDKGSYRYEMSGISFVRQEGCPGETEAVYGPQPSLFGKR